MRCVLAVTTYNRLHYLQECLSGFLRTRSEDLNWTVMVADDGSTDGTLPYLERFPLDYLVVNPRCGVAHQTNTLLQILAGRDFDYCFKCDDDIVFRKPGWDRLYVRAVRASGWDHLAFDHPEFNGGDWCRDYRLDQPVRRGPLLAMVAAEGVKGCFYTLTPRVLKRVGYLDSVNFFHGLEHTDYSLRCGRAGLASPELAFDAAGSHAFLGYRFPWNRDQPALSPEAYLVNGNNAAETGAKLTILRSARVFVPYRPCERRMK